MDIKIALAGNPNCGKTTLFNALTGSNQYVGNWPGVTVEKKEGRLKGHKEVVIQDLPGIYSLSPYSPEEVVARNYLTQEKPEAVLNIVDGTNLERNLYLTTQLLELDIPVVVAVNMADLTTKNGDKIDLKKLAQGLGCPVYSISALKGTGVDEVVEAVLMAARSGEKRQPLTFQISADEEDPEEALAAQRYDFIAQVVAGAVKPGRAKNSLSLSDKIDRVVTNRLLALPIFAVVMFLIYSIAMGTSIADGGWAIGTFATDWANDSFFGEIVPDFFNRFLLNSAGEPVVAGWLYGLIMDGVVAGVGAVLGFVPQMLVLFLLLAILEDIGYMARIAFIMDRVFRRFGLSGKSFIPMLVATGCGVPGIMASRTIEQERDRRMTVMTTGFIPCGAKLPIIGLFAGAVFGGSPFVAVSCYFMGVASVVISGILLKKTKPFAGEPAPFVMELPAYHLPSLSNVLRATWERGWSFIKRAGTVILLSSVVLWFLQGFGMENGVFGMVDHQNNSLLAAIGSVVAIIFAPLGFDWKATVATFTGLIAKENVVSTFGVLYNFAGELGDNGEGIWSLVAADYTAVGAYAFMTFNLLCAPCFAAMGAIKREMNSPKWTAAAISYMCLWAYAVALVVYQLGGLATGELPFGVGTVVAIGLVAALIWALKPARKKSVCTGNCASCGHC